MDDLLERFAGQSVLVVGDVMLDEYVHGESHRVSQEASVPIVENFTRTYAAGGAANVAVNVAALGGKAILAGVVGDDSAATRLRAEVKQQGVQGPLTTDPARRTTTKTRILAHGRQMLRLDSEDGRWLSPETHAALQRFVAVELPRCQACVMSDYDKGVFSGTLAEEIIALAKRLRVPVVVDPKGADIGKYAGATVVKPNAHEAVRLAGLEHLGEAAASDAAECLLGRLDGTAVLLTLGERGMMLFRQGQPWLRVPTAARQVFDVIGAGDTVAAVLALSLAAGGTLEQGVTLANRAAGVVVGKAGTATVSREELHVSP